MIKTIEQIKDGIMASLSAHNDYALLPLLNRIQGTTRVTTMATNDKYIYINPNWSSTLPQEEMYGVFCHEIMHITYAHVGAPWSIGKNPYLVNVCQDIIINEALLAQGRKLPSPLLKATAFPNFPIPPNVNVSQQIYDIVIAAFPNYSNKKTGQELKEKEIVKGMGKTKPKNSNSGKGSPEEEKSEGQKSENDKEKEQENSENPIALGSIIKTKDGKYGEVTSVTADGDIEYDEIMEEEAKKRLDLSGGISYVAESFAPKGTFTVLKPKLPPKGGDDEGNDGKGNGKGNNDKGNDKGNDGKGNDKGNDKGDEGKGNSKRGTASKKPGKKPGKVKGDDDFEGDEDDDFEGDDFESDEGETTLEDLLEGRGEFEGTILSNRDKLPEVPIQPIISPYMQWIFDRFGAAIANINKTNTYSKPNRRQMATGDNSYLKKGIKRTAPAPKVIFYIDISGSMRGGGSNYSNKIFQDFKKGIKMVRNARPRVKVFAYDVQELDFENTSYLAADGGSTYINKVFEDINKETADFFVVLTDARDMFDLNRVKKPTAFVTNYDALKLKSTQYVDVKITDF